jgi:hypothetical protein
VTQLKPQMVAPPVSFIDCCCPLILARMWHGRRASDRRLTVKLGLTSATLGADKSACRPGLDLRSS